MTDRIDRSLRGLFLIGCIGVLAVLGAVLFLLFGCAPGRTHPQGERFGEADVKQIDLVVTPVSPTWWKASAWYDPMSDLATPTRVVISGAWACVQDAGTVDDPRVGQPFKCPTRWRSPRHR